MLHKILPCLLAAFLLAALAACDSGPDKPASEQAPQSELAAQQNQIQDIFEQVSNLDEGDLPAFERLYKQAIDCCPDTKRVHEAYHRLYNVYIYGSADARYDDARALCEQYLERYPGEDAPLRLDMLNRMLGFYSENDEYEQEAALYDELYANGFEAFPLDLPEAHAYGYAEALEQTGRMEEAVAMYRIVVEHYEPGHFIRDLAEEALARLGD